jgi:hypothetical protein
VQLLGIHCAFTDRPFRHGKREDDVRLFAIQLAITVGNSHKCTIRMSCGPVVTGLLAREQLRNVMIQALRAADMSPPRFEDGVSTSCVTFPRHSLVDPQTLSWLAGLGEAARGLSRDQRNALVLMKAGEVMSNARYRQISDADSRVASRELADLVNRKLAEAVGGGGYTEYVLAAPTKQAAASPGRCGEV